MKLEYLWIMAAIAVVAVLFGLGKARAPLEKVTEKDIRDALNSGNKILAIKYYRTINNCNLTEGKQAIEEMAKGL